MQANITADLVKKLKPITEPKPKPYEVWDTELKGFILRVQPSGTKTFIVEYARHRRIPLGQATPQFSAADARKEAGKRIADHIKGNDPMDAKRAEREHTLESYVSEKYKEWAQANMRHSKETLRKISSFYGEFGKKRLPEITSFALEKYRSVRLKAGISPSTANRELDTLRAALNKAVQWGLLKTNPASSVKRSKVDSSASIRYLSPEEEKRLHEALEAREGRRRRQREEFNQWRRERGYREFPPYQAFTDHLKPITFLALNTGLRRGELFNLQWPDIDIVRRVLTVVGRTAKSQQTRHIPLNDEASKVVEAWHSQRESNELVFPGPQGKRLSHIKTSWAHLMQDAKIENFRFHDCRHDFASKLVMAGVDLNTVRELLGHSDIKMTLRYAHLAPGKLAAAVAKLSVR